MPPGFGTKAWLLWPVLLGALRLGHPAVAANPAPVRVMAAPVVISAAPDRPIVEMRGPNDFVESDEIK